MKRLALVCLLATAVVGLHAETYVDNARVRSVDPQYESVSVPREECSSHWVNETRHAGGRSMAVQWSAAWQVPCWATRSAKAMAGKPPLMHESPGPSLQVRVSVDPVGR